MDLVFLIDSSRSVRSHEFETMRKFMIDILKTLDIGLDATRVGVVQYSSQVPQTYVITTSFNAVLQLLLTLSSHLCPQVRSEFSLKTHSKVGSMVKSINEIIPLAQGTMTGLAIRSLMNDAFTPEQGDRPKVPQVLLNRLEDDI